MTTTISSAAPDRTSQVSPSWTAATRTAGIATTSSFLPRPATSATATTGIAPAWTRGRATTRPSATRVTEGNGESHAKDRNPRADGARRGVHEHHELRRGDDFPRAHRPARTRAGPGDGPGADAAGPDRRRHLATPAVERGGRRVGEAPRRLAGPAATRAFRPVEPQPPHGAPRHAPQSAGKARSRGERRL